MLIEVMGPSGVGKSTILAAAAQLRDLHPPQWVAPAEADKHFQVIPKSAMQVALDEPQIADAAKSVAKALGASTMNPSQILKGLEMLRESEFARQCVRGANFQAPVVHDELLLNRALSLLLYSSNLKRDVNGYLNSIDLPDAVVIVTNSPENIRANIEERGKDVNVYRGLDEPGMAGVIERGIELCALAAGICKDRGIPILEIDSSSSVDDNAARLHEWVVELATEFEPASSELRDKLLAEASTFKSRTGRHQRRDQSVPYASFITRTFSVLPGTSQRDTAQRLRRFGVKHADIKHKRVLDIGSNTGSVLLHLSNFEPAYGLGLEFDETKVELATRIADQAGLDQLEFRAANLDDTQPENIGEFDVVFCLAVEAHVGDRDHLFDLLGAVTTSTVYFEGNGKCDVNEVGRKLRAGGFTDIQYLGLSRDDAIPANNARPLILAHKPD